MPVEIFRNDDEGYADWVRRNPDGWVLNAKRRPSPAYLKLHRARCPSISVLQAGYRQWTTGEYIKVCAEERAEVERWATSAVGATPEDGCHCVQHGVRRPSARTARVPTLRAPERPASPSEEGFLDVRSPTVIPFEPKDPDLVAARERIRRTLGTLRARPGQLLHGVIEGQTIGSTDLDNALLYNVGGPVAATARYGVTLERRPASAAAGVRYRYRLTSERRLGEGGEVDTVAELSGVDLGGRPRHWTDVWLAVRTSPAVTVATQAPSGALTLRLTLGAPRFPGSATGELVKTLVDGVCSALHAHADRHTAPEIGRRMSSRLPLPAAEVADLLTADDRAALGTCERLVVVRDQGVQCQAEDERIAVLEIEIDRSADCWTLSGRLALA